MSKHREKTVQNIEKTVINRKNIEKPVKLSKNTKKTVKNIEKWQNCQ